MAKGLFKAYGWLKRVIVSLSVGNGYSWYIQCISVWVSTVGEKAKELLAAGFETAERLCGFKELGKHMKEEKN